MSILQSIMAERRADVAAASKRLPLSELRKLAAGREHHSLIDMLASGKGLRVIAEIKKASPSAGLLRKDYAPAAIARAYEAAGAAGISVLTEPRHFLGRDEHLREVREAVDIPVLRKDFIGDVYQVYETAALGADVILLIVAALDVRLLTTLYEEAIACRLDVLVESHTATELKQALALKKAIVGINSRNLKTLKTDLSVARELGAMIPKSRLAIAESGIRSRTDLESLQQHGYRGFLIGETLMAAKDPAGMLKELIR